MLELWGLKLTVKGEEGSASSIQGFGLQQRVETRPTQYGCRTECHAVSVCVQILGLSGAHGRARGRESADGEGWRISKGFW